MDENPRVFENSDTEEQAATVSDTSQPVVRPSVTEGQPVPVTQVINTTSQVQQTEPGDYVTQDEETYQHYYNTRGLNKVKTDTEKSDTKADI